MTGTSHNKDPTCYNCTYLDRDEGRAHLYGYGFCTCSKQRGDTWVNTKTKRNLCKHHEFRGNENENKKTVTKFIEKSEKRTNHSEESKE